MSYTPLEQKEHRAVMALELLAFKAKVAMAEAQESTYHYTPSISMEDLNECFVIAGLPLIVPEATNEKEIDVIKVANELADGLESAAKKREVDYGDTI